MRIRRIGEVAGHFRRDGKAKARYESRREAQTACSPGQRPYECSLCNGWHVGRRTPS